MIDFPLQGGGSWFSSAAAEAALQRMGKPVRRDIRSAEKGNVLAGPPRKMVYPTVMNVSGTQYRSTGVGEGLYRVNGTEETQNLTSWFIQ